MRELIQRYHITAINFLRLRCFSAQISMKRLRKAFGSLFGGSSKGAQDARVAVREEGAHLGVKEKPGAGETPVNL